MSDQQEFKAELLRRVQGYRESTIRAERRLEEVQREVETQRRRRDAAERLFEVEFGEQPEPFDGGAVAVQPPPRRYKSRKDLPRSGVDGPLTGLHWQDAIAEVLRDNGPLHVREIWERLDAGGFRSEAQDPLRSIVAVALRTPGVSRAAPNTYQLDGGRTDEAESDGA